MNNNNINDDDVNEGDHEDSDSDVVEAPALVYSSKSSAEKVTLMNQWLSRFWPQLTQVSPLGPLEPKCNPWFNGNMI